MERVTGLAPRFFLYGIKDKQKALFGVAGRNVRSPDMKDLKIPVVELGNGSFQVSVDMTFYSVDAITATSYKYTDRFYVHQQTSAENDKIATVILESKDGNVVDETVMKQYCNDLIDQQVRVITNKQFGHIRDLIVEEAFKPVNK